MCLTDINIPKIFVQQSKKGQRADYLCPIERGKKRKQESADLANRKQRKVS